MTIVLLPETERRLTAEASRRGVEPDKLAQQFIDSALPDLFDKMPNQSSIDLLNEWEIATATDDSQEIARRQLEFEEFKREMNQTRLMTDGPTARIPFP